MAHARTIALCGFALAGNVLAQGWVDRTAVGGPPAMTRHSLCWHPFRQYVMLARSKATPSGPAIETWSWNGAAWTFRGDHVVPETPVNTDAGNYGGLVWQANTGQMCYVTCKRNGDGQPFVEVQCAIWDGEIWLPGPSQQLAGSWWGGNGLVTVAPCFDANRNETLIIQNYNLGNVIAFDGTNFNVRTSLSALALPASSYGLLPGSDYLIAPDPSTGRPVATQSLTYSPQPLTPPAIPSRFFEWNGITWNQRLPPAAPFRSGAMASHTASQCLVMFDGTTTNLQPGHTWTYTNGVMQRLVLPIEPSLRYGAAMAYDPIRDVCVLFGGTSEFGLFGDTWELRLPAAASFTPFGAGCAGSRGVPGLAAQTGSLPRAGTVFAASVTNLPWTGPAVLALGVSDQAYGGTPLPLDLGFLGAPGCSLRASIEDLFVLTNVLGAATWSFAIPPVPGAVFYAQALPFDPAANPLGLTVSNAARGVVGF